MAKPNKTQSQGRMRLIFTRLFQIGLFGGIAAVIALIVAVAVTMSSLPGFEAMKYSPNGQMVRVHAADGSVIVQLGPSFGKWLSFTQIHQVMVDAIVTTEYKSYYINHGVSGRMLCSVQACLYE